MAYNNLAEKIDEAARLSGVELHRWATDGPLVPLPVHRKDHYFTSYLVALKDNPKVTVELNPAHSATQWAEQISTVNPGGKLN